MIWLLGGYLWMYVHRPFEVWPALGSLQIERGYMLLLMLVWLVTPNKSFTANRAHLGMGGFALALLVTWLASAYAGLPGSVDLVENYFKVAVFYVMFVTTVRDERALRRVVTLYLAAVSLYATHSLWEYLHGRVEYRMGTSRMIGVDVTYRDPNAFAAGLLIPLVLSLALWLERPRRLPRWALLGAAGLFAGCILLTGSRSGFLGLCVVGLTLPLFFMKRKATAVALVALAVVAGGGVLAVALPDELANRYLTIIDSSRGPQNALKSAEGRLAGLTVGVELWQRSPLLGHGPGSFPFASGLKFQPHNLYGQVLSEMGLLGGAALALVVACFWLNFREARRLADGPAVGSSLPYHVAVTAGLCAALLLMLGMGGHNLYRYHWQWLTAFQVAAVACVRGRRAALGPAGQEWAPAARVEWAA